MSGWEIALIIIVVLGVIASNLAVLKYSAKFKFPSQSELNRKWDVKNKKQQDDPPSDPGKS
jgi:hypothetical protein